MLVQENGVNRALRLKEEVVREILTVRITADPSIVPSHAVANEGNKSRENDKLQWQYFDERAYVDKTKLKPGQDAYARNKFNQAASDQLMSNREIPDSRHSLYVVLTLNFYINWSCFIILPAVIWADPSILPIFYPGW